jgi:hypothetical protein
MKRMPSAWLVIRPRIRSSEIFGQNRTRANKGRNVGRWVIERRVSIRASSPTLCFGLYVVKVDDDDDNNT